MPKFERVRYIMKELYDYALYWNTHGIKNSNLMEVRKQLTPIQFNLIREKFTQDELEALNRKLTYKRRDEKVHKLINTCKDKMNKKFFKNITIFLVACIILTASFKFLDYKLNYQKYLSKDGLTLLNDYEFPWEFVEEDGACMEPYDVGDGVMTFGPGVTYPTTQDGLDDINERFETVYSLNNKCINLDILFNLQKEILTNYESIVYKFAYKHNLNLTQNEFDALVLLAYNSPNFIKDKAVIKMLKSSPDPKDYIEAIDSYYQTLNSYYDNPLTDTKDDGYGEGWYKRIVDSSEVYFYKNYDYQDIY